MSFKTKVCTKCEVRRPVEKFSLAHHTVKYRGGRMSICKPCRNKARTERNKKRYHSDPEFRAKVILKSRKWQEKNPEVVRKNLRDYYLKRVREQVEK